MLIQLFAAWRLFHLRLRLARPDCSSQPTGDSARSSPCGLLAAIAIHSSMADAERSATAGSPLNCSGGKLTAGDSRIWTSVDVQTSEISFQSHGSKLGGTLLEPPGPGPHPLVVFVHGSERTSPMSGSYPLILGRTWNQRPCL